MKKTILLVVLLLALAALGAFWWLRGRGGSDITYRTAVVERGALVSSVSSTGNLNPVVTVQVGSQVSGMITEIYVDFNSPVKKGQPIALIDPALFRAQLEQAQGNYLTAEGNLIKAKVAVDDARRTLGRNVKLLKDGTIAQSDLDTAQTAYDSAVATIKVAEGALSQNHGSLDQAKTNLNYTTIRSPVDGIVVSRNVDRGQTVASSFQTPTLFNIAQDLTRMEIDTSVDEADISKVFEGQRASFTVDAYPEVRFSGMVTQVRNSPVITQNVVTYVVVIGVDNSDLRLKPGMTANVSFEVAKKDDVLILPAAALRFRPSGPGGEAAKPTGAGSQKGGAGPGRTVYVLRDGKPVPVPVKTGIANDRQVELLQGDIKEKDEVVLEQVQAKKKTSGVTPGPRF